MIAAGTLLGDRYRLESRIALGGMGEVWRAYDTEIDRVVALKMLLAQFGADATFEQRFRREARAAARLDDPHVVPLEVAVRGNAVADAQSIHRLRRFRRLGIQICVICVICGRLLFRHEHVPRRHLLLDAYETGPGPDLRVLAAAWS